MYGHNLGNSAIQCDCNLSRIRHFLLAKKNKIRVDEFSLGLDRLFLKTVWRNKIQLKASSVWRSLHDGRR